MKKEIIKEIKENEAKYPKMNDTLRLARKLTRERLLKKQGTKLIAIGIICLTGACSSTGTMFNSPDLTLVANQDGINSFFTGLQGTGAINNQESLAKHHQLVTTQEASRTMRHLGWKANKIEKAGK